MKAGNKLAPIWAVTNGPSGQHNIVDTVPGRADYSPLWQVRMVTWKSSATPRLLRSASEVEAAEKASDVTIKRTSTVAPSQTDYPPLWSIIAVQWKDGANKTLLRSAADVQRAKAKRLLTTKQTGLVVNCPVVA